MNITPSQSGQHETMLYLMKNKGKHTLNELCYVFKIRKTNMNKQINQIIKYHKDKINVEYEKQKRFIEYIGW